MTALLSKLSRSVDCMDWRKHAGLEKVVRKALKRIKHDHIANAVSVYAVLAGVNARRPKTFDVATRMAEEAVHMMMNAPVNPDMPENLRTHVNYDDATVMTGGDFGMALEDGLTPLVTT